MKQKLFVVLLALIVLFSMAATPALFAGDNAAPAMINPLNNVCAVCLVEGGKANKGDAKFSSVYDNRWYCFPSEDLKKKFDDNPEKYIPACGGNCVVCIADQGKEMPGSAEFYTVHNNQLFVFCGADQKKTFDADPKKYVSWSVGADGKCSTCVVNTIKYWSSDKFKQDVIATEKEMFYTIDGLRYYASKKAFDELKRNPYKYAAANHSRCVVSEVDDKKWVMGSSDFVTVHKGRPYFFASKDALDTFTKDPSKYENHDLALGGYCSVCFVEGGNVNKLDYSKNYNEKANSLTNDGNYVVYRGQFHLLPSADAVKLFKANPEKYVGAEVEQKLEAAKKEKENGGGGHGMEKPKR